PRMQLDGMDMPATPSLASITRQPRHAISDYTAMTVAGRRWWKRGFQPATASHACCGTKRRIETLVLVMITKLDGGMACHSLPSRSSGSDTRQRPRPSRTADV